MRRTAITLGFLVLAVCSVATLALGAEHFTKAKANVIDGINRTFSLEADPFHGGLLISFTEAGLGSGAVTDYVASASATATYACINGGGKHPQASNKITLSGPVSGSAAFTADGTGQIRAEVSIAPLGPGAFTCPPGQTLVLASVSYTNVRITDTTNNVFKDVPGTYTLTLVDIR